jgi:hypothetical protein
MNGEHRAVMSPLPPGNSNLIFHTCRKGWRCGAQQLILLLSVHCKTKTAQSFMSANIGKMTLHTKRRSKCETEAKIQDTQVSSSTTRIVSLGLSTFSYVFFQGATIAPIHPSSTASPCLRGDWYWFHFNNIPWRSSAIVGTGIVLANAIQSLEYNAIVVTSIWL